MSDLKSRKADARKLAFARRGAAHESYRGNSACDNLLEYLQPHLGRPVSAYLPIRTEIDPLSAMVELSKSGPVAVPVIVGNAMALEFHRWRPGGALQDGPFGVKIPLSGQIVVPRVVVLPLLAFDSLGCRLGYGGGFYDRTLQSLRKSGSVLAVGFAYSAQASEHVPTGPTDQRLDALVTEIGTTVFSTK